MDGGEEDEEDEVTERERLLAHRKLCVDLMAALSFVDGFLGMVDGFEDIVNIQRLHRKVQEELGKAKEAFEKANRGSQAAADTVLGIGRPEALQIIVETLKTVPKGIVKPHREEWWQALGRSVLAAIDEAGPPDDVEESE